MLHDRGLSFEIGRRAYNSSGPSRRDLEEGELLGVLVIEMYEKMVHKEEPKITLLLLRRAIALRLKRQSHVVLYTKFSRSKSCLYLKFCTVFIPIIIPYVYSKHASIVMFSPTSRCPFPTSTLTHLDLYAQNKLRQVLS